MPVSVLEEFDDLTSKSHRLASVDEVAAAFHDHISDHLFRVRQLFNEIAKQRSEVELQIDEVFLQQNGHNLDRGKWDFEVDICDELVDEAKESCSCLFIQEFLFLLGITNQLH